MYPGGELQGVYCAIACDGQPGNCDLQRVLSASAEDLPLGWTGDTHSNLPQLSRSEARTSSGEATANGNVGDDPESEVSNR